MLAISVVMSVYNGEATLQAALDSIFAQTERDFEVIVVDDGSTDGSASILAACRDPRLRVITQPNAGLTRALIAACAEARGRFIARHDSDDRSVPDRFAKQLAVLESDPSVVLVSCATSYHTPRGERLYVTHGDADATNAALRDAGIDSIRGLTAHGSAMFRRDAYVAAGGYRAAFYFAQDLDLWIRLVRYGRIAFLPDVLYEARIDAEAISSTNRPEQIALARIAIETRDHPEREADLLADAAKIGPRKRQRTRRERAMALYFIASCLRREHDARWRGYALDAVRTMLVGR